MQKHRVVALVLTSAIALFFVSVVFASGSAAGGEGFREKAAVDELYYLTAPSTSTVQVAILNKDNSTPYNGRVPAYYDSNGNIKDYLGASWIGAEICALGNLPGGVKVQLLDELDNPFPPYNSTEAVAAVNKFMLGNQESGIRTLPTMSSGECQLAYFYLYTPRDWKGTCQVTIDYANGGCRTRPFQIVASEISKPSNFGVASSSIYMDANITAQPGTIEQVIETSTDFFTLTVLFESGNVGSASGSGAGTWFPTAHYAYNANALELIGITAVATETVSTKPLILNSRTFTKETRLRGIGDLSQDPIKFVYLFRRVIQTSVNLYPGYAANSGSTNYKGGADLAGVPTAITLGGLSVRFNQPDVLIILAVALLLALATLVVIRGKQLGWRQKSVRYS